MGFWISSEKMVKVAGVSERFPHQVHTEVAFSEEAIDRGGFFDPSAPTRITIPSGLGGWYRVMCTVRWIIPESPMPVVLDAEKEARSYFYAWLKHNGTVLSNEARSTANRVTGSKGTSQVMALETHLADSDVLSLVLWQSYDPDYIQRLTALSFLSLHRTHGLNVPLPPFFSATEPEEGDMP